MRSLRLIVPRATSHTWEGGRLGGRGPTQQLILASTSPRRRELLHRAGVQFHPWDPGDDPPLPHLPSWQAAAISALIKSHRGAQAFPGHAVLGADTVVVLEGETLGKPRDTQDAIEMLETLSGRTHCVYTAFCLTQAARKARRVRILWLEVVRSEVRFRRLTGDQIARYVASGAPLDKAGAYGIQDRDHNLVESVRGSYYNVVGLPVRQVLFALEAIQGIA